VYFFVCIFLKSVILQEERQAHDTEDKIGHGLTLSNKERGFSIFGNKHTSVNMKCVKIIV
jgi:hypothetical protein